MTAKDEIAARDTPPLKKQKLTKRARLDLSKPKVVIPFQSFIHNTLRQN